MKIAYMVFRLAEAHSFSEHKLARSTRFICQQI